MAPISKFFSDFYNRNLFERLVIYLFLAGVITKIGFELILGQWSFDQSRNKQWIFYALLALDYLVCYRRVINIRVTVNPTSMFAFVFFIMVAHGTFIGIMQHNQPFVIVNDIIPVLMIGMNILRMQSASEWKPIDLRFLLIICTLFALSTTFFGLLAEMIGRPSGPSLGSGRIYLPLFLACLFMLRPFPKWTAIAAIVMIGLNIDDINRTTMAFMGVAVACYILVQIIRYPVKGLGVVTLTLVLLLTAVAMVPEDSKTYGRIADLTQIDLSSRTGSIGERTAEWDAIRERLKGGGETTEWFGLGFGGLYTVQFTHKLNEDYGHAHYAWAWFNLRYGQSGYVYLAILFAMLIYNTAAGLRRRDETGMFVALLCMNGIIFCLTHVNSLFLLNGLHFYNVNAGGDKSHSGHDET